MWFAQEQLFEVRFFVFGSSGAGAVLIVAMFGEFWGGCTNPALLQGSGVGVTLTAHTV